MTDAQRETPVPKGHEACDSTSMKCSEELHPWSRWLVARGGGRGAQGFLLGWWKCSTGSRDGCTTLRMYEKPANGVCWSGTLYGVWIIPQGRWFVFFFLKKVMWISRCNRSEIQRRGKASTEYTHYPWEFKVKEWAVAGKRKTERLGSS